jgi:branched-chain amino acid transport system permease protein
VLIALGWTTSHVGVVNFGRSVHDGVFCAVITSKILSVSHKIVDETRCNSCNRSRLITTFRNGSVTGQTIMEWAVPIA